MTKDFIECGDTIYWLAPDRFGPEKINYGRLFYLKKECLAGIHQLGNILEASSIFQSRVILDRSKLRLYTDNTCPAFQCSPSSPNPKPLCLNPSPPNISTRSSPHFTETWTNVSTSSMNASAPLRSCSGKDNVSTNMSAALSNSPKPSVVPILLHPSPDQLAANQNTTALTK